MTVHMETALGPLDLAKPLVGASGTIGSVVEFAEVADLTAYGAATAKSVSAVPWPGRDAPRLAPTEAGMLNAIGIQNPGIETWLRDVGEQLAALPVKVIGSAVGYTVVEYVAVAVQMATAPVVGIEVNLSCPNLEGKGMFALDAVATHEVIAAIRKELTCQSERSSAQTRSMLGKSPAQRPRLGRIGSRSSTLFGEPPSTLRSANRGFRPGSAAIPAWRSSRSRSAVFWKFARPIQACRSWVWEGCSRGRMALSS